MNGVAAPGRARTPFEWLIVAPVPSRGRFAILGAVEVVLPQEAIGREREISMPLGGLSVVGMAHGSRLVSRQDCLGCSCLLRNSPECLGRWFVSGADGHPLRRSRLRLVWDDLA